MVTMSEKLWNLTTCSIATSYVFIALISAKNEIETAYALRMNAFFHVIGVCCLVCSTFYILSEILDKRTDLVSSIMISFVILCMNIPIFFLISSFDASETYGYYIYIWEGSGSFNGGSY